MRGKPGRRQNASIPFVGIRYASSTDIYPPRAFLTGTPRPASIFSLLSLNRPCCADPGSLGGQRPNFRPVPTPYQYREYLIWGEAHPG